MKQLEGINGPPGDLVSRNAQITEIGFCGHCSAPFLTVISTGKQLGVYIDDTTPHRRHWIITALQHHPDPQHVFVGIGPNEGKDTLDDPDIGVPHTAPPELIRLKEWLPWGNSEDDGKTIMPWREFGKVPPCGLGDGYILQMNWKGYYGHNPPNEVCRTVTLQQAKSHHPRFIFFV